MISLMTRVGALLTGGILMIAAGDGRAQPAAKPRAQEAPRVSAQQLNTTRGVIKSVSDRRLVLDAATRGPAPDTLVLDEKTVVLRLRGALTVKELKVGDLVTVSYTTKDGKAVATRVWVRPPRAGSAAVPSKTGASPGN